MAEWLVEQGIGEERAVLLEGGRIVASRLRWPGAVSAGQVVRAVVSERLAQTSRAIIRLHDGTEAFLRRSPSADTVGSAITALIEREAMAERGRLKRAQAVRSQLAPGPAPSFAEQLQAEGHHARIVHRFPKEADWGELIEEARSGEVAFSGGALLFADTPAMTLIDVDGGPPEAIWHNAVPAIVAALARFDLGGNIGIDFPTLTDKGDRQAVDRKLGELLANWPHERTAMNGFGFVQIVARLTRPSLLRRLARDPAGAAARHLLRMAEGVAEPGALLLTAHPAIIARLVPEWLAELERRTGRVVRLATDPSLAPFAAFAQAQTR